MRVLLFLVLVWTTLSCDRNGCGVNLACTEEFRSLGVTIMESNGEPVSLDSYTVMESGQQLTIDTNPIERGWHVIFSDAFQDAYENREVTLTLEGTLNGVQVVNEKYVVGADCCHVYMVSGREEITLP